MPMPGDKSGADQGGDSYPKRVVAWGRQSDVMVWLPVPARPQKICLMPTVTPTMFCCPAIVGYLKAKAVARLSKLRPPLCA